jgi:hypothetical protein
MHIVHVIKFSKPSLITKVLKILGAIWKIACKGNMVKVLIIMHHIALCTPCIALYVIVSYLHFCVRPCGARTRGATGPSTRRGR